jgi:superfamily I DNA/RNA helicase
MPEMIPLDFEKWRNRLTMMPNRTACDILEEMRKCYETRNFSYLLSLVEEMQSTANRMEASLYDKSDYERIIKAKKEEQKKLDGIKKEIKEAERKLKKLKK